VYGIIGSNGHSARVLNNMVSIGQGMPNGIVNAFAPQGSQNVAAYNNSFRIVGSTTSTLFTSSACRVTNNNTISDYRNNIFQCDRTGADAVALALDDVLSSALPYVGVNNIFYSVNPRLCKIATNNYNTLAGFRTALSGVAGNSESVASKEAGITFVSNTNLHTSDFDVIRAGVNLSAATPAVIDDFDGDARSITCLPSIGADEVFFQPLPNRTTWTGSVNTRWCEPCNWDRAAVPTATTTVLIEPGAANLPALNTAAACGVSICDTLAINVVNGLVMQAGADLGLRRVLQQCGQLYGGNRRCNQIFGQWQRRSECCRSQYHYLF
jgi:hypothetical protein